MSDEAHTYTVHFQFSARDDDHAREIAAKFEEVIEQWHEFVERDDKDGQITMMPNGYVIEAAHLTDADDWAEHVGAEDVCAECGKIGDTNRCRTGQGNRVCLGCMATSKYGPYPIVDVQI